MLTTQDVVTEESVMAMVQAQTEANYGFRQLFRNHNGSSAGPSMKFPVTKEDFDGAFEEIEPGTEYPKFDKEYGEVEAVYTKYGFEVDISDEAMSDGILDLRLDQTRDMLREETRRLNSIAAGVVSGNRSPTTYGDGNDDLNFGEVVDARAQMSKFSEDGSKDGYTPDMLLVDPLGAASILKDDAFQLRDTPVGDRAVLQGFIGSVAGMDIFEENSGALGDYNAYMADTSRYGYESAKYRGNVSSRREGSQDKTTFKIKDRLDWVATNPNAVAKIEG